jgi:superfamily I DNA/RNA helicase
MNLGPRVNSLDAARAFLPNVASFDLKSNCRQSPGLSRKVHDYLGLDHSGLTHLVSEDAEATFVIKHVEKGEQLKELERLLKELMKKYPTQEIRIVSPLSTQQISLFQLFHATEVHSNEVKKMMPLLKNLDGVGEIGWRSVSKYKGMEADVVIVIDLDDETAGKLEVDGKTLFDQLYVGMTRARFALYLITSIESLKIAVSTT